MTIVGQWPENSISPKEAFIASRSESTMLKDVPDGTVIDVAKYILYDEVKEDKKTRVCVIFDTAGTRYATISITVISVLEDYTQLMEDELRAGDFQIVKKSGTTRSGRPYVNVEVI